MIRKLLLLVLLFVGNSQASSANRQPLGQAPKQPNIIIIMADDLDSRQLSCYGGRNIKTVNIDGLASEGMKFNHMLASEAMCIPTRASLFTGLYPARHGAYQNHKSVRPDLKSVGHYLAELGYDVGLTGKDHVTKPASVFPFKIVPGFETNCVSTTDEYFLDSVRTFITAKEKPFCLFVMSCNPHAPWTVGDPSEFDADKLELPAHWVDTKLTRTQFTRYLAEVRRLDNQVGDIRKLITESGLDKNTIVIFLGEQGPQFPGGKWNLWENGMRSSMIVKWPGVVKAATQSDALVQYEDITPALIDIAGGKQIADLDGRSFLAVLKGKTDTHREYAFGIHNNIPEGPSYPMRYIRDNNYKYILNLTPDSTYKIKYMMNMGPNQAWTTWLKKAETDETAMRLTARVSKRPAAELYDLASDPDELVNLATNPRYAEMVKKYEGKLRKWMDEQGDTGAAMDTQFDRKN